MAVVELEKIGCFESWFKLLSEDWSIIGGDTEANSGTDVAKDGITDRFGHLRGILVSYGKVEAVFASFGQNNSKGISCEVLELINIEIERATVGDVRDVGTAHGGKLDFGHKEGTQDTSVVFADETFR